MNQWIETKTDYRGRFIYENGDATMCRFDGGYIGFKDDEMNGCYYYIKDYQGNNRMVVKGSQTIDQVNHYYPDGSLMGEISIEGHAQKFRFGGKELDKTYGLNLYDFHARQYDPQVPAFTSIDPLSENDPNISPYTYCAGDPVNCVDPTGMSWYTCDSTGYSVWFNDEGMETHEREGYTYVGEEGALLGELENKIDLYMRTSGAWKDKRTNGLYENNTSVLIDNSEESNYVDWYKEFQTGTGPEIRVLTNQSNPYIQQLKQEKDVKYAQYRALRKNGSVRIQSRKWGIFDHFTRRYGNVMHFIGTYGVASYSLKNLDMGTISIVYDRKSLWSLMLHSSESHSRHEGLPYGNTYQFYILINQ